ncbi:MAG: NADH-ubiquinone oxidoreductase-F iron-sulfur binding region domain-containing protein [Candidatus Omnitrophota bacterium]
MKNPGLRPLDTMQKQCLRSFLPDAPRVMVGMGTCGIGNNAGDVLESTRSALKKTKTNILLTQTGCFGFCAREPLVNVYLPGKPLLILQYVTPGDVPGIIRYVASADPSRLSRGKILCKVESWDHLTGSVDYGKGYPEIPGWKEVPFFKDQLKIVLRDCGLIDPENIEEYFAVGGYRALYRALHASDPEGIIAEVRKANLRGRGGAGFPTWKKWDIMRNSPGPTKYIVCNADEGDPGAYMNRNEIESDPHSLIEGMAIGGYTMGAENGIMYVRAEYPLAVRRLKRAINDARSFGILGGNIFGSGVKFDIDIIEGAGAFVCGEETALIASCEGHPGRSRPRPPYPAEKGFRGMPTNINNVETWCNIPVIIAKGGSWFAETGSGTSTGTKVFSLVGKIRNTGLVELPLGLPLSTIVNGIGGGTGTGRRVKAVQTGGPSGGCIPASLFNTPVDYESLTALGAIMGSGGMVVMDEDNCMVDVARYFVEFTSSESCGRCVPCREGLRQALKILTSITEGTGTEEGLATLEELGSVIKDSSLCGLGQTAPNPFLTTLKYFHDEYKEHLRLKRCASGVCEALVASPCGNSCPLSMNIPGFIQLVKEGRLKEAFELAVRDNPLPATTGRVCHHPCERRCRRTDLDDAISQRGIHSFIADEAYKKRIDTAVFQQLMNEKLPDTGKRVALVGSGPASLTAAFYLARLGHSVTVYDGALLPGGALRLVSDARLPKSVLNREIGNIKKLGVTFIQKIEPGKKITFRRMLKENDAVFVGERLTPRNAQECGLAIEPNGSVVVDPLTMAAKVPGVYAGGEAVRKPAIVTEAMGSGKRAARSIDRYCMNEERFDRLFKNFSYDSTMCAEPQGGKMVVTGKTAIGYTLAQAKKEAARCLRCDVKL